MTKEEELYIRIGHQLNGTEQSQLFGKPCFKIKGKAFICFFQNEMVFKLSGNSHQQAINLNDAKLFDPSGKQRPMKEWVQVPAVHSEKWVFFAEAAKQYVGGI